MIKSFKHKGLKKLYETGSKQGVKPEHAGRLRLILARLDASSDPGDMNAASAERPAEKLLVCFRIRKFASHFPV